MPRRNHDDLGIGAATALGLTIFVGGLVLAAQGAKELTRYRPQLYTPVSPDHPTMDTGTRRQRFIDIGVRLIFWAAIAIGLVFVWLGIDGVKYYVDGMHGIVHPGWAKVDPNEGWLWYSGAFLVGLFALNAFRFAYRLWKNPPQTKSLVTARLFFRYFSFDLFFFTMGVVLIFFVLFMAYFLLFRNPPLFPLPNMLPLFSIFVQILFVMGGVAGLVGLVVVVRIRDEFFKDIQPFKQRFLEREMEVLSAEAEKTIRALAAARNRQRVYTIYPTRGKADYITTSNLMQSLLEVAPRLTFQIVADVSGVYWRVVDPLGQYVPETIISRLQDLSEVTIVQGQSGIQGQVLPLRRQYFVAYLQNEYVVPLPFLDGLKNSDPLTALTRRMSGLRSGERITYWVMVLVGSPEARYRGVERTQAGYIVPRVDLRQSAEVRPNLNTDLITQKLSGKLYHCFVGIMIDTEDEMRSAELAHIVKDMQLFEVKGQNGLGVVPLAEPFWVAAEGEAFVSDLEGLLTEWKDGRQSTWLPFLLPLSPQEIAALWHMPNEEFDAEGIIWATKSAPSALSGVGRERVTVGTTVTPVGPQPVSIALSDRAYHHHIVGETGMGKSTLILNLIMQDIEAGRGVAVIDPHGKLVNEVLDRIDSRVDEARIFECGNSAYPVPLNPFRIPPGVSFEAVKTANLWALLKIYADIIDHHRMRLVLGYVLDALLCDPEATPLDIRRLFTDTRYRTWLLAQMEQDPHIARNALGYWQSYGKSPLSAQRDVAEPILNRTGAFLGNRTLENITCHPQALDIRALVEQKAIVLVNLAGEAIETEMGSLASLFLAQFYMASKALTRHEGIDELSIGAVPRYYLYIDEMQRVATSAFDELLAQVRKFGLSLTLVHQYLDQLPKETVQGILGNVGTMFVFEVGNHDAGVLAPYVEPDVARGELVNLGTYRAAVKTRHQGTSQPGFIINTYPPPPRLGQNQKEYIQGNTLLAHYMLSEKSVREWLDERYKPPEQAKKLAAVAPQPPTEIVEAPPPTEAKAPNVLPELASQPAAAKKPKKVAKPKKTPSTEPDQRSEPPPAAKQAKKTPPAKPRRKSKHTDYE